MLASPSRSPVSITFTLASCLKNTASVCTSTLKNKPEIVVLLSFILFDFHERPHFTHLGCIQTHKTTEQLVKTPHNHHRIRDNLQMTCIKRSVLVVNSGVVNQIVKPVVQSRRRRRVEVATVFMQGKTGL